VKHDVQFHGSNNKDTLTVTGTIGHDLVAHLGSGNDIVNLSGSIGHDLFLGSRDKGGNKTVNLGGKVGDNALVRLGFGNDTVNFTGTVAGRFHLLTGAGSDTVTFGAASKVKNADVNLGQGNDTFFLASGATISGSATINGGPGTGTGSTFKTSYAAVPGAIHLTGFKTIKVGVTA
jgi:hypothetical protein